MRLRYLLAGVAALIVAGCSSDSGSGSATTGTTAPAPAPAASKGSDFKVALLTPGPVSDNGWSALAYKGLTDIHTQLGAEVANQEASGSKIKDAMRSYAQSGFSLVIGH